MEQVKVVVLPKGTMPSQMMQTDANYAGMQMSGYTNVNQASDLLSSSDQQFMQDVLKAQTSDLKSFQGKMSGWALSPEGKQFISQWDQKAMRKTVTPTKVRMSKANFGMMALKHKASPTAKVSPGAKYLETRDPVDLKRSPIPSPTVSIKPSAISGKGMGRIASPTVKASPGAKYARVQHPTAYMKPSPSAKAPGVKRMQTNVMPEGSQGVKATVRATPLPSPTTRIAPSNVTTPAQSYGIYGLGGEVPYFKVSPTPVAPRTSTVGTAGAVPLNSEARYAGRGPGIMDGQVVQPPASAKAVSSALPASFTPKYPGEFKASPPPGLYPSPTPSPTARHR